MIHGDLISSKSIIAKLISDLDLKEDLIQISSIKEWIAEAVEKIGAVQQFEKAVVITLFENYQAKLPYDLHSLNLVSFGTDEDNFYPIKRFNGTGSVLNLIQDKIPENVYTPESFKDRAISKQNVVSDVFYTLKPGYININKLDGYLKISYYKIYTDDDGMPMIPNMQSYLEAIFWYVAMKMTYPKYLKGLIHLSIYYDMRNSWAFYRKLAYAEAMMPDMALMESIKDMWIDLYPTDNHFDSEFSNLGRKQTLNMN